MKSYSISELANEFDITTRTIRFYEDRGLVRPTRQGQQRIYSRADRARLKLVLRGKRFGWPLDEIQQMIELYDEPGGEKKQLEVMIARLHDSRENLLQQRRDIDRTLGEFDAIEMRCRQRLEQTTDEDPSEPNAA